MSQLQQELLIGRSVLLRLLGARKVQTGTAEKSESQHGTTDREPLFSTL